ncbi:MAG: hypothetical protein KIH63_005550 [Candidatus Saccharibacteria bacterium]|nr:hypothetical protein [Candidatus Saccharibacteria bacterium]
MATTSLVEFHSSSPERRPGDELAVVRRPVPKGQGEKYSDGIEFEVFDDERTNLTSVIELYGTGSVAGKASDRDQMATHTIVGSPQMEGEYAFLPVEPPHLNIGANATLTSVLGRAWDPTIHIHQEQAIAAQNSEVRLSVAHHHLVPGHIGMRAEANEARKKGDWSVWEDYLDSNSDIVVICEVLGIGEDGIPAGERDALHAKGSIVVRAIVDSEEVHPVETLLAMTEPVVGETPNDHHYNIGHIFADAAAHSLEFSEGGENSDLFEAAVAQSDLAVARQVLVGTMFKILNPTTDFAEKRQKIITDENGNDWEIPKDLAGRIEEMYGFISKHEGSASEPAHSFFKAHLRLQELDRLQSPTIKGQPNPDYRPNAQASLKKERQRVWFGLAHVFQYLAIQDRAMVNQGKYHKKSHAQTDFNGNQQPTHPATQRDPRRLEFLAFGKHDAAIAKTVAAKLKEHEAAGQTTGLHVLRELLAHLKHGKRNPGLGDNFYINVLNPPNPAKGRPLGNYYRRFFDTVAGADNGVDVVAHGIKTHQGMPYGSKGTYAYDEVFASLFATQDPETNPNLPHGGLLCSGIVTAGELNIPETLPGASSVPGRKPKLVGISLKYAPDLFRQALYGPVVAAGSLETQRQVLKAIIDSNLDLASVVADPNIVVRSLGKLAPKGFSVLAEDAWHLLAEVDAQPEGIPNPDGSTTRMSKRIEPYMDGGVLRNGDAVAVVRADLVVDVRADGSKVVATQAVPIRGKIAGEEPLIRKKGKIRTVAHTRVDEPKWRSPTDSRGRVILDADGDPITAKPMKKRSDGSYFRKENRLIDARLARGTMWATRDQGKDSSGNPIVTDVVGRQFRVFTRVRQPKVMGTAIGKERRELVKP